MEPPAVEPNAAAISSGLVSSIFLNWLLTVDGIFDLASLLADAPACENNAADADPEDITDARELGIIWLSSDDSDRPEFFDEPKPDRGESGHSTNKISLTKIKKNHPFGTTLGPQNSKIINVNHSLLSRLLASLLFAALANCACAIFARRKSEPEGSCCCPLLL